MNKTQLEYAKEKIFTQEMGKAFLHEEINKDEFLDNISNGKIVIPANKNRKREKYYAIGKGCLVKINVNIGVSSECGNFDEEIKKLELCREFNVESVMDLSSGKNSKEFRKMLLKNYDFIVGTVPVYDTAILHDDFTKVDVKQILELIEMQAEEGVDFFTLHAGINRKAIERFKNNNRIMKIVSRGGGMIYNWMMKNDRENPFYEYYDEILKICKKHDVTLSLGDSLRPGCVFDSTDALQIEELINLGELTKRAWDEGVQVMIEGPGHMRANEIAANMVLEKKLCKDAPFYVLGPLTTDIGAGYDHISGAMGALIAALNGADFLCYLTPAEHLRLPSINDVKEGIIAFKLAAHSANIAKGFKKPLERDYKMSTARKNMDWEEMFKWGIDEKKMREYKKDDNKYCTMCGKLCPVKNVK
ncbi:phosphomethylpyrimidine synthase ThiC [Caloramator sp. E03]|uniref:phosphomethylpyrimidine synthase ThiC n=1 Tax=Caloramator sp. E03 TaxID=2576307 RepID=UPI001110AF38|nr:phosphomethylpyrimidine synthase ThiC [Caloramator sp. E03]QCX33342.1 phosphomethylpyrimidine synthase ThiC [Caloramator sp. E03]